MAERIPTAAEVQKQALRTATAALLADCTDAQRAGLHRIHDGAPWKGLANCPPSKLADAYELVRRTAFEQCRPSHGCTRST